MKREIINADFIAQLENDSNWDDRNIYIGTIPAVCICCKLKGMFYDNGQYEYKFISETTVRRIPYSLL